MWFHWPCEHLPGSKGGAATAFRFPPWEFARLDVAPVSPVHPILHCWAFLSGFLNAAFPPYLLMRHQHSRRRFEVLKGKSLPQQQQNPPAKEAKLLLSLGWRFPEMGRTCPLARGAVMSWEGATVSLLRGGIPKWSLLLLPLLSIHFISRLEASD